jgi:hypothetical protein
MAGLNVLAPAGEGAAAVGELGAAATGAGRDAAAAFDSAGFDSAGFDSAAFDSAASSRSDRRDLLSQQRDIRGRVSQRRQRRCHGEGKTRRP